MSTEQTLRTQADVFRLPTPRSGEAVYFDAGRPSDRAPGLALRIRAAGSRKYVFFHRHGGRLQKHTIGDASSWKLDQARAEARRLRVKVDRGENPATERATKRADAALLFSTVARDYLGARRLEMRSRSLVECTRHLEKYWKPLHSMSVSAIDRTTVAVQLNALADGSGAVTANRARSTLSAMFAWAIGEGLCETNPVIGTNKRDEGGSRTRVLTDAELAAVWNAAPDNDYGVIVKLLMLTAQRREEIGALEWSEIDMHAKLITLPASRTKNKRPHEVPLAGAALTLIENLPRRAGRSLVFGGGRGGWSGWSQSKRALDAVAGLSGGWTLHDLRRTAATRMADIGVLPHVIEAVLNHVGGHKAGVAGIYNRSTYAAEKRAALELWASHLRVAIAKASGANVRELRRQTGRDPISSG